RCKRAWREETWAGPCGSCRRWSRTTNRAPSSCRRSARPRHGGTTSGRPRTTSAATKGASRSRPADPTASCPPDGQTTRPFRALLAVLPAQGVDHIRVILQGVGAVGPREDDVALHARLPPVAELLVDLIGRGHAIVGVRE